MARLKMSWGLLGTLGKKIVTTILQKQAQAEQIGGDGPSKKQIVLSSVVTVGENALEQYVLTHPELKDDLGKVNDALIALQKKISKLEAQAGTGVGGGASSGGGN